MCHKLPLVAAQPAIWAAERLYTEYPAWSVAHYVELVGELNVTQLKQAIISGMMQADTLRMRFQEQDGEVVQWFDETLQFDLPEYIDLRHCPEPHNTALTIMNADLQQDLRVNSGNSLVMHKILQLDDQRWYWYQRYHHIQVDGFSFSAITQQIAAIYRALQQKQSIPASPFTPFQAVVDEYLKYQNSDFFHIDKEFWNDYYQKLPIPASLSTKSLLDKDNNIIQLQYIIENQFFAHKQGCQSIDLALALVTLWLGKLCGRMNYSAEFMFMRRIGSVALAATGPVVNMLPFAIQIDEGETLPEFAQRLTQQLQVIRRHQRYNSDYHFRDRCGAGRNELIYGPVLNVKMFDSPLEMPKLTTKTHLLASGPVDELELALLVDETGQVTIELLANGRCFERKELEEHLQRISLMVRQFIHNPTLRCGDVDVLLESEYQQQLRINHTHRELPITTLSCLVATQEAKTPDAIALVDQQYSLTYDEMRKQVVALSLQLKSLGVKLGDSVAIALPRSIFLTLSIHAIAEIGAAWLPLDIDSPDRQLDKILKDAQPILLITLAEYLPRFSGIKVLCYNALLPYIPQWIEPCIQPEHTAYIMYTSGSTGVPKGVMIGQKAIVNRLLWMQESYPLASTDVVIQKTPCSFDVSVWEFWWPLIAGARLVMLEPQAHLDPLAMMACFKQHRVTTAHFVPSMLAVFIESYIRQPHSLTLKQVFCSGEALPTELCRRWERLTHIPLYNLYGPTEAAIDVSYYKAYGDDLAAVEGNTVPIGYPIWNSGMHILDSQQRPVPFGVAGELYLTGVQLAQGYLKRPDLTDNQFIFNPLNVGQRMYRTGDIARWLSSGAVEYLGRTDSQLKIRGQRVELGEVECAMLQLPDIAQAVAHACILDNTAQMAGDTRQLVGYVTSISGQQLDMVSLREQLSEHLSPYMLPSMIVQLDVLPLSKNGKLNRKRLPLPELLSPKTGRKPLTKTELIIAKAYQQLLGCHIESIDADFFALGGHSLLAIQLAAQLSQQLSQQVTPGQIMVSPTIGKLAARLNPQPTFKDPSLWGMETILPLRERDGPTLFCFHPASGFAWQFSGLARHLSERWSITGLQSPRPMGAMMAETIDDACEQHLKTLLIQQPQGPYYLLGYSLGGTLAQGVAARLRKLGKEVLFLGLLDTWPPEVLNWRDRAQGEINPDIIAKIAQERTAFMSVQTSTETNNLFRIIEQNYTDAVRLLTTAHTLPYDGKVTLFVAQKTLPEGLTPKTAWAPWVQHVDLYPQDCTHVDIISPKSFTAIGPVLRQILG